MEAVTYRMPGQHVADCEYVEEVEGDNSTNNLHRSYLLKTIFLWMAERVSHKNHD